MSRFFSITIAFVVGLLALLLLAGEILSAPARRSIGPPPTDLAAESVTLPVNATESVFGWFARGQPGVGVVLLLHGVRGDRRQMVDRAKFLHAADHAVLLIDLPAHGESGGDRITFGFREAAGVRAAVQFLRATLPGERIGVIGVSLGAASLVLAGIDPPANAVVLESMYPTIAEAVADRLAMRLGTFGSQLAPVLLWQLPLRIGIDADQLRPIEHLPRLNAPVLIASGMDDLHTTATETRRLFAAASEPKELWLVDRAAHVDLHALDPPAYEAKVYAFLNKHLRDHNSSAADMTPLARAATPR
jgi:fermentation-respiration switch protein FrsA (DUF1100 family)